MSGRDRFIDPYIYLLCRGVLSVVVLLKVVWLRSVRCSWCSCLIREITGVALDYLLGQIADKLFVDSCLLSWGLWTGFIPRHSPLCVGHVGCSWCGCVGQERRSDVLSRWFWVLSSSTAGFLSWWSGGIALNWLRFWFDPNNSDVGSTISYIKIHFFYIFRYHIVLYASISGVFIVISTVTGTLQPTQPQKPQVVRTKYKYVSSSFSMLLPTIRPCNARPITLLHECSLFFNIQLE